MYIYIYISIAKQKASVASLEAQVLNIDMYVYIYIYIYICVCVCVAPLLSRRPGLSYSWPLRVNPTSQVVAAEARVNPALGYLPLWDNNHFYLRVRSLPGGRANPKPPFSPFLDSTVCIHSLP